MPVVSGVSSAIVCIVYAGFCRLVFGLIDWVERQTFAKWLCLLQAPHVFPFAGYSFMLCMDPPQYPQARVLVRGFPRPLGFSPMAAYTGSVLIGMGSATSICGLGSLTILLSVLVPVCPLVVFSVPQGCVLVA